MLEFLTLENSTAYVTLLIYNDPEKKNKNVVSLY